MHVTAGDRIVAKQPFTPPAPEITSGGFDAAIASEDFVFEPIARWARESPDRSALVSSSGTITYTELETRTNQVARALRARGVQRGDLVALLLPRGPEAILALVSVLKSGAAYVPLDADSPTERVRLCLEDAAPKLVVAQDTRGLSGGPTAYSVTGIATLLEESAGHSEDALSPEEVGLQSKDLAYVIFTSGTTGRPKGVPISHRSLTNFVRGDQEVCIRVSSEDHVFQGFSPASDGHHEEVWPTFQAGATLVVASTRDIHSGPELGEFLMRHEVTVISCAPTLLSMVEQDIPSIKRILFGAERCPEEMLRRWWQPGREIINTYGPTEATVGATFALCSPDGLITIGRPLPNYFCYILDDEFRPVPPGREGELCISGIGLSRGYLGNERLTSERFIPNPFAMPGRHDDLLYRTGDRARLREDGNIEWLGRVDTQVKVRGYRIELSDIESHLMEEPSVRSVAVVLRNSDSTAPQLAALLVARAGKEIDPAACLDRLRRELPAYMVPQALEQVNSIPTLPSGKVDRRAVQVLRGRALESSRDVQSPQTETERMLLGVWRQLFPGSSICRTDDFFTDLGGYSLLAAHFISILRGQHALQTVSVLDIYEHARLAEFAAFLDAQSRIPESHASEAPPFNPVPPGRYARAAAAQGVGILVLFGLKAAFWLAPVVAAAGLLERGATPIAAVVAGLLLHALSVPLTLLLTVVLKWAVVGRFRAGDHPLWGGYFVRCWFIERVMELAPKEYLTGTPLAAIYLRLLGARIGRNVILETADFDCPDLVEIGDDCVVESFAWIRSSSVVNGCLSIRPIRIGRGCVIGVRAGVAGGAVLGEGALLADLSCATGDTIIPDGEEWAGAPARRREPEAPAYDPGRQPSTSRRRWFGVVQTLMAMALPLIDSIPFLATALLFYRLSGPLTTYLAAPAFSILFIVAVCGQVLVVKWLVVGKVKPGIYPTPGLFALRKWFAEKHLELHVGSIIPLYDSLYTRPWCIAMGMRCGPRSEIALPARLPYDLIEMGEEGFLSSDCSVGMHLRRNGQMTLERTVTGKRVFLGNNSVIPQGTRLPDESLVGALSVCPSRDEIGSETGQAWLGSPAFRMPRREHFDQFDLERTYRPTARLYAERLLHETVRILLPSIASLFIAVMMITEFVFVWHRFGLAAAFLSTPLQYLLASVVGGLFVFISKKVLVGVYRPTVQPLWSRFVWKTETFSMVFHDFGAPLFTSTLLGTPYLCAFLRLLGAKIGRRAFINSGDLTECDLIHIGDDAAINHSAALQAHLFEDRVMKVGRVSIGDRCSVGTFALVLFDSEMKAESQVGPISLVMKGETIPCGTLWEGAPARSHADHTAGLASLR